MGLKARIQTGLDILKKDFQDDGTTPPFDFQTTTVFVTSTVLLTLFYYYGRSGAYRRSVAPWLEPRLADAADLIPILPYAYWGLSALVLRVLVPLAIIVFLFRQSPREWGFRLKGIGSHLPLYAAIYAFMVPFLFWAAAQPSFANKYPFYRPAIDGGGAAFWWYEAFYSLQFIGVEAFFRGFLTFGLYKKFGYYALYIMAIPYVMIHFNKPIPETLGALIAGVVLGYLALKSKSFVPGILLHVGIAITMDVLAIAQHTGGLAAAFNAIF